MEILRCFLLLHSFLDPGFFFFVSVYLFLHFHLNMPGTLIEIALGFVVSCCKQLKALSCIWIELTTESSDYHGPGTTADIERMGRRGITSLSAGSALCLEHSGVRMMTVARTEHSSHYFLYLTHVKIQILFVVDSITVCSLPISKPRPGMHRDLPQVTCSMSRRFTAIRCKFMY